MSLKWKTKCVLLQISELKMSYENFFWAKTSVAFSLSFENWTKHCGGSYFNARNWRAKHMGIQLEKFKSDTCNWTPTWSRADYVTNRRAENQSQSIIAIIVLIHGHHMSVKIASEEKLSEEIIQAIQTSIVTTCLDPQDRVSLFKRCAFTYL